LESAGPSYGDLVSALLAPAGSATMAAASSASLTALEHHCNHVGFDALLVVGGFFRLLLLLLPSRFLLAMQGYGCGCQFSACIIIGGGVSAGNGNHLVQGQLLVIV
jgi:hypothetical protein